MNELEEIERRRRERWDREQERMDRWEQRGRFFQGTVIGRFVLPVFGVAGLFVLVRERVLIWELYIVCVAVATAGLGSRTVASGLSAVLDALSRRGPR